MRKFYYMVMMIILVSVHCGKDSQTSENKATVVEAAPVKVVKVEQRSIAETVKVTGEIKPLYQLDIFPKANGVVVSEEVALGEKVHKDQVLAKIRQDIPGMEFSLVKIEATNDGYITMDAVEIGATLSVQRAAYTISQMQTVYMTAKLIESLISEVQVGKTIDVKVDAYTQKKFEGIVSEISPVLDQLSRTVEMKIRINNSDLKLKPGMFAQAFFQTGKHSGLIAPLDAIVRSGANQYIFIIKNNKAKRIKIKTGIVENNKIEIFGSIQQGDDIVILGQNLLEDGMTVRITEEF